MLSEGWGIPPPESNLVSDRINFFVFFLYFFWKSLIESRGAELGAFQDQCLWAARFTSFRHAESGICGSDSSRLFGQAVNGPLVRSFAV